MRPQKLPEGRVRGTSQLLEAQSHPRWEPEGILGAAPATPGSGAGEKGWRKRWVALCSYPWVTPVACELREWPGSRCIVYLCGRG